MTDQETREITHSPTERRPVREDVAEYFGAQVPTYDQVRLYLFSAGWRCIGLYSWRERWRKAGSEVVYLTPYPPPTYSIWPAEAITAARTIARVEDRALAAVAADLQAVLTVGGS